MKQKKTLFVFLTIFMVLLAALSIAAYAYDYLSALPDTNGSSPTVQSQESSMPVQGFEAQTTDTSTGPSDVTPTTYSNGGTHPYGTWNNPYTNGVDGYNYTDPQDYTSTANDK
ncbi:MAG: hypothetical protein ACYC56_02150 [Candidatus Aquicultor sp.]